MAVSETKNARTKVFHATESNTEVSTWFERDRANVSLNKLNGDELLSFWDDDVAEMVEDGFLNPRDWHGSLVEYYNSLHARTYNPRAKRENARRSSQDVAFQHQVKIAKADLRLPVGADFMRVNTNEQAREILRRAGWSEKRIENWETYNGEIAKENPRDQFLLVDGELNPIARSFDYDLLQDKADRHNEESDGDFYYVIKARDHETAKREKRGGRENPRGAEYRKNPRNDSGTMFYLSFTNSAGRSMIIRYEYTGYGNQEGYSLRQWKNRCIKSAKFEGFQYHGEVSADQYYAQNPVSQELKDAIESESATLAQESEALKGVVNPHSLALVSGGDGFVYTISADTNEAAASILKRAEDFYGKPMSHVLRNREIGKGLFGKRQKKSNPRGGGGDKNPHRLVLQYKVYLFDQDIKHWESDSNFDGDDYSGAKQRAELISVRDKAPARVVAVSEYGTTRTVATFHDGVEHNQNAVSRRNSAGVSKDYKRRGFDYLTLNTGQDGSGNTVYVVQWKTTKDKRDGRKNLGQLTFTSQAEAENYIKHGLQAKNGKRARNDEYSKLDFFDDKVDEISAEFTGEISGETMRAAAADHTPAKVSRLGQLRLIKVAGVDGKEYDLKFSENDDAWLVADRRKNLHFVGQDTSLKGAIKLPKKGQLALLGNAIQVDYFTTKRHIESARPTYFYHELGEVDGITPAIYIDSEGFLRLFGGNYDIWTCGIVN